MSPNLAHAATGVAAISALAVTVVILAAPAPALAFPFFGAKPAASPAPPAAAAQTSSTAPATAKPAPPKKATAGERAAANRLDPLSRSVFWARETNIDPTDVTAGVELGTALRQLGHYDEARQALARVLIVQPNDLPALLESARVEIDDGKGFYAIAPLKTAIAAAPRDWRAYSLMGVAREQNQQPDDAHAAYLQALQRSPDNPAVLSNLALWYATHGDHAQAETLLRRAAAEPASTAKERQNLALLLGMEGRTADAERLMREDLPPDVTQNNLAYLKAVSGKAP